MLDAETFLYPSSSISMYPQVCPSGGDMPPLTSVGSRIFTIVNYSGIVLIKRINESISISKNSIVSSQFINQFSKWIFFIIYTTISIMREEYSFFSDFRLF